MRRHLDDLLRPSGVTALQYTALTVLERRDGLTVSELARNSFVTTQSMADLLEALLKRDLVSRRPDPQHGRRRLISLTPRGRQMLAEQADAVRALEAHMLRLLDDGEAEQFRDYLNRCRAALAGNAGPAH